MNCKSFKNKNLQLRHAEFILKTGNKSSFIDWNLLRSFFKLQWSNFKRSLVCSFWKRWSCKQRYFSFQNTGFSLFWFDLTLQKCKQWPCSIRLLSAGGWPTACFVDTTIFLISEVHEQVHVGQPTSFYHLRWLSLFWFKHTTARTFFKTKI